MISYYGYTGICSSDYVSSISTTDGFDVTDYKNAVGAYTDVTAFSNPVYVVVCENMASFTPDTFSSFNDGINKLHTLGMNDWIPVIPSPST